MNTTDPLPTAVVAHATDDTIRLVDARGVVVARAARRALARGVYVYRLTRVGHADEWTDSASLAAAWAADLATFLNARADAIDVMLEELASSVGRASA